MSVTVNVGLIIKQIRLWPRAANSGRGRGGMEATKRIIRKAKYPKIEYNRRLKCV